MMLLCPAVAGAASAKRIVTAIFVCETFPLSGLFHQLVASFSINAIHSNPSKEPGEWVPVPLAQVPKY